MLSGNILSASGVDILVRSVSYRLPLQETTLLESFYSELEIR